MQFPVVLKYGATRELAIAQAEALALRVMAEQVEVRVTSRP